MPYSDYRMEELLSRTAATPEELRQKQELIDIYGGGIEVVNPNSPISAKEFAEGAMLVFEEQGYLNAVINEIDVAMNTAAADIPGLRSFTVALQHDDAWARYVAFDREAYEQSLWTYTTLNVGGSTVAFHVVDLRSTAQRYEEPKGLLSFLRGETSLVNTRKIGEANSEIAMLFAQELGQSLFDYYNVYRGFGVSLDPCLPMLCNWFGVANDRKLPFAIGLTLNW